VAEAVCCHCCCCCLQKRHRLVQVLHDQVLHQLDLLSIVLRPNKRTNKQARTAGAAQVQCKNVNARRHARGGARSRQSICKSSQTHAHTSIDNVPLSSKTVGWGKSGRKWQGHRKEVKHETRTGLSLNGLQLEAGADGGALGEKPPIIVTCSAHQSRRRKTKAGRAALLCWIMPKLRINSHALHHIASALSTPIDPSG